MALTGKIRKTVKTARFLNVLLALCVLTAQLLPTAFAAAATLDDSDYMVICTADGFKKVPLAELGLQDLAKGDAGADFPAQEDCPLCLLMCAHGLSDAAPHGAVVRLPRPPLHHIVRDDRPVFLAAADYKDYTPPRAPPAHSI